MRVWPADGSNPYTTPTGDVAPAANGKPILPPDGLSQKIVDEQKLASPDGIDDYLIFQGGVKRLSGIDLAYYKRRQMERRTRAFAVRQGIADGNLATYLELLKRDRDQLNLFLDRMTINVSQLWRNPEHFDTVTRKVFPLLAEQRGAASAKIWSAGCSYGAEVYTLAAMCIDHESQVGSRPQVVGTDIDERMIEMARAGWFSVDDARSAPAGLLEKHFTARDDGWQASEQMCRIVSFKVENLFEAKPQRFDLIVCRNVAIYFTEEARNSLHSIFANALNPGGFLMIGATELVSNPREIGFERAFPFIYKKIDG